MPICAPNAVCSKIDLYESPWIERQCRCPKQAHPAHVTINYPKEPQYKIEGAESEDVDYDDQQLKALFRKLGVYYNKDGIDLLNENNDDDYTGYHISNSGLHKNHPVRISLLDAHDTKKIRHSAHRITDGQKLGGCPTTITTEDGHTIADKTRLYKLCDPIHKLPQCR